MAVSRSPLPVWKNDHLFEDLAFWRSRPRKIVDAPATRTSIRSRAGRPGSPMIRSRMNYVVSLRNMLCRAWEGNSFTRSRAPLTRCSKDIQKKHYQEGVEEGGGFASGEGGEEGERRSRGRRGWEDGEGCNGRVEENRRRPPVCVCGLPKCRHSKRGGMRRVAFPRFCFCTLVVKPRMSS